MKNQKEKLEEERKIFYEFTKIIAKVTGKNEAPISSAEAKHFRSEFNAISKIVQETFFKGFLAGAVSLVGLRWIRHGATRWFSRRGTPYDVRTHLEIQQFAQQRTNGGSPFHDEHQKFKSPGVKAFHFVADVCTSLLISCFTMYQCFDLNKVLPTLSRMPLTEGRSRVAELLCEDFVKEMKKYPPEFWDGVQHPRMKAIAHLGWNCQRRWAYEKFLRKQEGIDLDSNVPVIVPPPGVPPDYPIDGETATDDFSQYYWLANDQQQEQGGDWINGMVVDSEDDERRH